MMTTESRPLDIACPPPGAAPRRRRVGVRHALKSAMLSSLIVVAGAMGWHYRSVAAVLSLPAVLQVPAAAETEAFPLSGDVVDDAAVWIDPVDAERSIVIASIKSFGLAVYDLDGHLLQTLNDGDFDNVDIRQDVALAGEPETLIAASRRDTNSVEFYTVDPASRRVLKSAQGDLVTRNPIYGICLHRDAATGRVSVFTTGKRGDIEQWIVSREPGGSIRGTRIRTVELGTATEGCVADDELGRLYVSEERRGIVWLNSDPSRGDGIHWVDRIGAGVLHEDVEGLALYKTGPSGGYLLASSQGNSTIVVYDRSDHHLVGRFHIAKSPEAHVDDVTITDGIEAVSRPMGARFPMGFLIAQDNSDDAAKTKQNLKLVSFQDIMRTLGHDAGTPPS